MQTKNSTWMGGMLAASLCLWLAIPAGHAQTECDITVDIFSGFNLDGGGAPYSGLVGSFTATGVSFATDTGFNWHPFDQFEFGADINGSLAVCVDGEYEFCLDSDDGSLLFIDGNLVVDNGGPHGPASACGIAALTAGTHTFEVQFFECCGGPSGVDLILPAGVSYGCAPQITCPADISTSIDPGTCAAVVNFDVTASSPCGDVTVVCDPPPGTAFPIGTTQVCCTATDNATGTTAECCFNVTVTTGNACPQSLGFWKSHPADWPLTSITLGEVTYDQSQLLAILNSPTKNDASLILARQLIAAILNTANGSDPSPICDVLEQAQELLSGFGGSLPYGVKPSSPEGQQMVELAATLEQYNTGALTPGCAP